MLSKCPLSLIFVQLQRPWTPWTHFCHSKISLIPALLNPHLLPYIQNLTLNYIAVSSCGMRNLGHTALLFEGSTNYIVKHINSSYNCNKATLLSVGGCFCIDHNSNTQFTLEFFNFLHSAGYDIVNVRQSPNGGECSTGNFYNTTSDNILSYGGKIQLYNVTFGQLACTSVYFYCGSSDTSYKLTLNQCYFDHLNSIPSYILYSGSATFQNCIEKNPFSPFFIPDMPLLDYCPIPSAFFTESDIFSNSNHFIATNIFSPTNYFTHSQVFSNSNTFSASSYFSQSDSFPSTLFFSKSNSFSPTKTFTPSHSFTITSIFSKSETYTKSDTFYPSNAFSPSLSFGPTEKATNTFTPSDSFTPSFTFSPMATKFPDGLKNQINAYVTGEKFEEKASPTAIGVTTGLSVTTISVSVVLMLLYLKSRASQVKPQEDPSFVLSESTESDLSYSYSFFTYDYFYSDSKEDQKTDSSEYRYSDFYGTYIPFMVYRLMTKFLKRMCSISTKTVNKIVKKSSKYDWFFNLSF